MIRHFAQFFRDCGGVSTVERGIYLASFGLWLVIALESINAFSFRH